MNEQTNPYFPPVPFWQIHLLRILFLLIAVVMGSAVWQQLLFESTGWSLHRGLAKSMLAALALLCLWGVRYPIQMLPLMVFELAWKTVWILLIALPAWRAGAVTKGIENLFFECIGVVVIYIAIPWRHVFARFIAQPMEPWRKGV